MATETWYWTISLWVPHAHESHDISYDYTAPAGVGQMEKLCKRAIKQAKKDFPDREYALLGTLIHGVVLTEAELLEAHPDRLNHDHIACPHCATQAADIPNPIKSLR